MERLEFIASFDGDLAKEHKLPAYEASQSVAGITRSLLVPANYLFEGRVRRRSFQDLQFRFNIVAQRPGSFETVYEFLFDPKTLAVGGALAIGVSANFISTFITTIASRTIGKSSDGTIEKMEASGELDPGDMAALVDASGPAMRDAHVTVEKGAQFINITGNNNVVNLNSNTKRFVNYSKRNDSLRVKLVSVSSFNSNTGYGRVFDSEEGRTIPFQLPTGIDAKSMAVLISSFRRYAERKWVGADESSFIALQYTSTDDADGKAKKLHPVRARLAISEI